MREVQLGGEEGHLDLIKDMTHFFFQNQVEIKSEGRHRRGWEDETKSAAVHHAALGEEHVVKMLMTL